MTTSVENKLARKTSEVDSLWRAIRLAQAERNVLMALLEQEEEGDR